MKFRKKPVVIDAIRYTGHNEHELFLWSGGAIVGSPVLEPTDENPSGDYVQIKTPEGTMTGIVGDWMIRGVAGEYYPCKHTVFVASYEPAEGTLMVCIDDICHGQGFCMHGDGDITCPSCRGTGERPNPNA